MPCNVFPKQFMTYRPDSRRNIYDHRKFSEARISSKSKSESRKKTQNKQANNYVLICDKLGCANSVGTAVS